MTRTFENMTVVERAARAAEREHCCRAVCEHCRAGVPLLPRGPASLVWCHDDDYGSTCKASAIRDLPPEVT